jgi:hypothetical protein
MIPLLPAILSTLLANNLPKVAQAVLDRGLDYVQEKTGIEIKPDMSGEEITALREAAQKHVELANQDRADARAMQSLALQQEDTFSKRFVMYLTIFWSVVSSLYIAGITFIELPIASTRFADTILGFLLGTVISAFVQFWVGSSNGSDKKTDLMGGGRK